jgi:hypothetical protein
MDGGWAGLLHLSPDPNTGSVETDEKGNAGGIGMIMVPRGCRSVALEWKDEHSSSF